MKVAIVGAGNIDEAIACEPAKGTIVSADNIVVSYPPQSKPDRPKTEFPAIGVTHDNRAASARQSITYL